MKILELCNKSPYPPREGGPIAMNMIAEGLLDEGHEVKILAVNSYKYNINPDDIPGTYRERTGIELIDVDLRIRPLAAFLNLFTGRSYHVKRFISDTFRKRLIEVLRETRFDIVQMETLFMAPYLETVKAHSEAKSVLRAHNIEHLIWSRIAEVTTNPLKRWYIRHLAATLKRYEQTMIRQFDGVVAITEKDADYFSSQLAVGSWQNSKSEKRNAKRETRNAKRETRIIAVPYGVGLDNFPPPVPCPDPVSLFTIGAMNWIPNVEGVRWFLHHVWPEVHKEFPSLKYYLAGREMPDWMLRMKFPNVEVLGEVPDAREFIDAHGIMVVPLLSGSGIRIKIIEGMAAGKPVLSTLIGAEGIDCTSGKNILIANAPCEFIDMISLCINDPDRCRNVGEEARGLVETTYNRRHIIRKLVTFYEQLTG